MATAPKTRGEAITLKAGKYYTGIRCKYGHLSERRTETGSCIECHNVRQNLERQKIRESIRNLNGGINGAQN